ncbi:MAG: hypothetical protein INH41_18370 [Myxococcaceae bacterium]|nr:hypothetical protein [Myxococcaceae bacterium]MCA3014353.1 hypothetical protein [Myxococcaceae bacterium]
MTSRALLSVMVLGAAAQAHPLDEGTTRVTLRDGHLDVHVEWDVFRLLGRAPTEGAVLPEAELQVAYEELRRRLTSETVLEVDGQVAPLVLRGFIEPIALRTLAVTLSAQGLEHGALVRGDLESTGTWPSPKAVTVRSPMGAGPVVASFVQPQTQLVAAGGGVTFEVLQPRPRVARAEASLLVGGRVALGLAVVGWREARRRT